MAEVKNTGRYIEILDPEPIPSLYRPADRNPSIHPHAGPRPGFGTREAPPSAMPDPNRVQCLKNSDCLDENDHVGDCVVRMTYVEHGPNAASVTNKPKTRKILLLGTTYLDKDQIDELRAQVQPDFPDHTIKIIVGLIAAAEFEVPAPVEVKSGPKRPGDAGYL